MRMTGKTHLAGRAADRGRLGVAGFVHGTPAWADVNGRAELIITGGDVISGHDPATGAEYWRADVLNPQRARNYRIIASPTVVGDLVIAPTRNNPMVAIRAGGKGDVAASHVAWTFAQGPDVPTPVSDGKLLYIVRDGGVAFALDVKTGATVYGPERLPSGNYSASPILADGKIYVTTEEEGITTVYRAGPEVRDPVVEQTGGRLFPVLPEHRGDLRRPAVHADGVVPLGDRRSAREVARRSQAATQRHVLACGSNSGKHSPANGATMSALETIKAAYAAFGRNDPSVLFGAMDPAINWNEAEGSPLADRNPYVGGAGHRRRRVRPAHGRDRQFHRRARVRSSTAATTSSCSDATAAR